VQSPCTIERDSDDATLLGEGLQDRLTNPPDGVGDELDPLGLVEFVSCPNEAEIPFVDQVRQGHALILVLLGHRDDESEVGSDQLVQSLLIILPDQAGEARFLLSIDERIDADLLEILIQGSFLEGVATPAKGHGRAGAREEGRYLRRMKAVGT
jgi:hypothetical protein